MTHDYLRNGTTTLFATFDVLDGTVIGQCMAAIDIRSSSASSMHRSHRAGRQGDPHDPRQLRRPQHAKVGAWLQLGVRAGPST